jgi:hypothetical protein
VVSLNSCELLFNTLQGGPIKEACFIHWVSYDLLSNIGHHGLKFAKRRIIVKHPRTHHKKTQHEKTARQHPYHAQHMIAQQVVVKVDNGFQNCRRRILVVAIKVR